MDDYVRIETLSRMTGETDNGILLAYIDLATEIVLNRAYPFGTEETECPGRYENTMLEIAAYLINKRGAEGQVSHSENGIARTYEAASVPASMLKSIIPRIGTLK